MTKASTPFFNVIFLSLFLLLPHYSGAQELSPGGVYQLEEQALWLDASSLGLPDNTPVSVWNDLSSFGNDAVQTNASAQPVFVANGFGGHPAVRFNGSNQFMVIDHDSSLDGTSGITFIVVTRPTAHSSAHGMLGKRTSWTGDVSYTFFIHNERLAMDISNSSGRIHSPNNSVSANNNYILSGSSQQGSTRHVYYNSTQSSGQTNSLSVNSFDIPLLLGRLDFVSNHFFSGDIAEIIIIRQGLNAAQLRVVENLLARKYGLQGQLGAHYHLGNFNPPYDHDIIGVGATNLATKHVANLGGGGGLYLAEHNNSFNEANEFVFAAHNGHSGVSTADLGGISGIHHRWNRVWYVERSQGGVVDAGSTDIAITFDFSEAGITPQSNILYALLYRSGTSGDFSIVNGALASVVGNRVSFTVPDADFSSGYFSLGRLASNVSTWYSFQNGDWDQHTTWSLSPVSYNNPNNLTPSTSLTASFDNVVIQSNHKVTASSDDFQNNGLTVHGILDLGTTSGHHFGVIQGSGRIELRTEAFPSGDASAFNSPGGGTVRFYGNDFNLNTPAIYNNVEVFMDPGQQLTLLTNYQVNGNLDILRGDFRINNDAATTSRIIQVENDVTVHAQGSVSVGTANARHRFVFKSNLMVNGSLRLSNLTEHSYTSQPNNGFADAVFNHPSKHQVADIRATADFYRIEIDKGFDDTYYLWLRANHPSHFRLLGQNNFQQDGATVAVNNNALGLRAGTVRIGVNIHIPQLHTGGSTNNNIYEPATLWIDGGEVTNPSQAIVLYGKLRVSNGSLVASGAEGITVRETGTMEVTGGHVEANIIRTSIIAGIHRGAYFQSGGTVITRHFPPSGDGYGSHYRFSFPYPDNSFIMQGGQLIVRDQKSSGGSGLNGGFLIGAIPSNISVTGGHVVFDLTRDRNFFINSTAPFYNLTLIKTVTGNYEFRLADYTGDTNPPIPAQPAQALHVLNNLTLESGRLNANGADLFIEKDFVVFDGSTYLSNGNTTAFTGSQPGLFEIRNTTNTQNLSGLKISKPDTVALTLASPGRTTNPANAANTLLQVSDNLSVQQGILDYAGFRVHTMGNVALNGRLGQPGSTGRLRVGGTDPAGIHIPVNGSAWIGHLELDNAAGVTLSGSHIGHIGTLSMTNGIFDIGIFGITVHGDIQGTGFGTDKMIRTAGNQSDGGLSRWITGNGALYFPLGTNANGTNRYTPLEATFANHSQDVALQLSLADQELPTLANDNPNEALNFFWRIRHNGESGLPTVTSYVFTYSDTDLPDGWTLPSEDFVPGKVVELQRSYEIFSNVNYDARTLTFNEEFPLEQGEYTAGHFEKFVGAVRVFYSRGNAHVDYNNAASWSNPATWSLTSHEVDDNPLSEFPGYGDLVQIGYDASLLNNYHAVRIETDAKIGGLKFKAQPEGSTANLPRLWIANADIDVNLSAVAGEGVLLYRLGSSKADVTADLGEFSAGKRSEFVFFHVNSSPHNLSDISAVFPNLRFEQQADFNLPESNILVNGDLMVWNRARVHLHGGNQGDIVVHGNLSLGQGSRGRLIFPGTGGPRNFTVNGDVLFNSLSTVEKDEIVIGSGLDDVVHNFRVGGNIDIKNGILNFYQDDPAFPRVVLELNGEKSASFTRNPIHGEANLYRIRMNKGQSADSTFTFLETFNLQSATANTTQKPLEILSGTLVLDHPGHDVLLSSGGDSDFTIHANGGLAISRGTARVTGANSGIRLDGLLHLYNEGQLIVRDGDNQNYIEFATSGKSTIIVEDNAALEVGSQIRGATTFDTYVLNYLQSGGTVTIGSSTSINQSHALLEIPNDQNLDHLGSTFKFTGGTLNIVRNPGTNPEPALYLNPNVYQVGPDAVINLGTAATPASQVIRVNSNIPLPEVNLQGNNNYTVRVVSKPLHIRYALNIGSGKTLDNQDYDLFLEGNLTNQGNISMSSGRWARFQGQSQVITGNVSLTNMAINSAGVVALNDEISTVLSLNNDLHINSGVLSDNGRDIFLRGSLEIHSEHSSSSLNGGITFNGAVDQYINGNGSLGNITLDKNGQVILENDIVVSSKVELRSGLLNLESNGLTLTETGFLLGEFSPGRMLKTRGLLDDRGVKKVFSAGENHDFVFPVGSPGKYRPVEVSSLQSATPGSIRVVPVDDVHPVLQVETDEVLRYYWVLTNNGLSGLNFFDLDFHFQDVDVSGDVSMFQAGVLTGGDTWQIYEEGVLPDELQVSLGNLQEIGTNWEFTAGHPIPEKVITFTSQSDGHWENSSTWSWDTGLLADFPVGGPRGSIAVILPEHEVVIQNNFRNNFKTIVEGTLKTGPTIGHYLGYLEGSGVLALENGFLPAGSYESFFSANGGTLELGGAGDYNIPPRTSMNNLRLTGSGARRLPNLSNMQLLGDFEILEQAVFDNGEFNHSLRLHGNLSIGPEAALQPGSGSNATIILNGFLAQQIISGEFTGTSAFNNLRVDNPQGVLLQGNIDIVRVLNLHNGIVYSSNDHMINLVMSGSVTGGSNQSHVDGPMKKTGFSVSNFRFPVGKDGSYAPVGVLNLSDPEASVYTAEYFREAHYNYETVESPLTKVSSQEYWEVLQLGAGSARIQPHWMDAEFSGITWPQELKVARYTGSEWVNEGRHQVEDLGNTGWVSSEIVSEDGAFTFASSSLQENPLPVELLEFYAEVVGGSVRLRWKTATETNNNFFTLERSRSTHQYDILGYVSGAGTTSQIHSYEFWDEAPFNGVSYYRLKQTDFDGQYEYFGPVAVHLRVQGETAMLVYPNPWNHGALNMLLSGLAPFEEVQWMLSDQFGRGVISGRLSADDTGRVLHRFQPPASLARGIYFLTIGNAALRITEKVIVF
jgi:hypothetical protein